MEAFISPSYDPSHYSKEVIWGLVGAGAVAFVLCVIATYYNYNRGFTRRRHVHRGWHDAKDGAHDLEMARSADETDRAAVQEYKERREQRKKQEREDVAKHTIDHVTASNGLSGPILTPPCRAQLGKERLGNKMEIDEDLYMQRMK